MNSLEEKGEYFTTLESSGGKKGIAKERDFIERTFQNCA